MVVRIRNRGPDAYRHSEYGDTIVVERKIAQAGSASGYKLKSHSGKLVSTRHDELMAICDHLQIEVDNPMAILTQDTARMFLSNSTPKDKYNVLFFLTQFFLKGTQLERLQQDYVKMTENMEMIQNSLLRKEQVMQS